MLLNIFNSIHWHYINSLLINSLLIKLAKGTATLPHIIYKCDILLFTDAEDGSPEYFSWTYLAMSMVFCSVAMLCKEQGITVLVIYQILSEFQL